MKCSRRCKIVSLPCNDVLDIFTAFKNKPRTMALPIIGGVPDDATILSVAANWQAKSIDFMIEHPSFDEVPNGEMFPITSAWMERYSVTVTPEWQPGPIVEHGLPHIVFK